MSEPTHEIAMWAVAAGISATLGPTSRVASHHHGDLDDRLTLYFTGNDPLSVAAPSIDLYRRGEVHVWPETSTAKHVMPIDWDSIEEGRTGVAATVREIVHGFPTVPAEVGQTDRHVAYGVLAATMTQLRLFGHFPLATQPFVDRALRDQLPVTWVELTEFARTAGISIDTLTKSDKEDWWLLATDRRIVGLLNINGPVAWPGRTLYAVAKWHLGHEPGKENDSTFVKLTLRDASTTWECGALLAQDVVKEGVKFEPESSRRPPLGIGSILSQFNRKERFFLATQVSGLLDSMELHGPSLPLTAAFRDDIKRASGISVPEHAYAATDFHFSWIAGALAWREGAAYPGQEENFQKIKHGKASLVDGDVEDIDLLIAWQSDDGPLILAVEAKAYGAWSNLQMTSKIPRLAAFRDRFKKVKFHLILMSHSEPQKITVDWQGFDTHTNSQGSVVPCWVPLRAPGLRLVTERRSPTNSGVDAMEEWHIIGP